jgi:hypothetical protein
MVKTLVDHRHSSYIFVLFCSHTRLRQNNTTPPTGTKTGMYTRWDNFHFLTKQNLNVPNCNHTIKQERYLLPDDGYMLSETCRRNNDGPLVF